MRVTMAVSLIALALYAATLAPGLTWAHDGDDGGDLATAVGVNGVPHPPGYPTYLVAGALAARIPAGDLAWRLNVLSAASMACASGVAAAAFARAARSRIAGAAAGLAWACAPIVWGQAVITEVYALNALFVALLVWLAGWRATGRWSAAGLGLAFGLGLGSGVTLVLCAPLVAWSCGRDARRWAGAAGGALAGALIFALLPLRAQAQPVLNWGDASRLDGFVWLVTARPYAGLVFGVPPVEWPQRVAALVGLLAWQFTPVGAVVAAWGLARLWRRDRGLALSSAASAAAYAVFATGYAAADSYVYLIPALLIAALWLGAGLVAAVERIGTRGAPALLLLPLAEVLLGFGAADLSRDRAATDWLARALSSAPPGAVLVSHRDDYTFALWYAHEVQHARPDVVVVDWDLWALDWYRAGLARETGRDLPPGVEIETAFADRPVCALNESGAAACRLGGASP